MIKKRRTKTTKQKRARAGFFRGDLLRWYFDDDKILGLYLGRKKQKHIVYFIDVFAKKKMLKYSSIKDLALEWKKD